MSRLLNRQEAAAYLGLAEKTVAKMFAARVLRVVKLGRSVRVREEDLERYIADHVVEPAGSRRDRRAG